jgi:steroid delta-isomerase-like uncharacterized protein
MNTWHFFEKKIMGTIKIIIAIGCAFLVGNCEGCMSGVSSKHSSERALVERFVELYNSFKIDEMVDLFTEDCLFQNISNSSGITECRGQEDLRKLAQQSATIFSSRKQTVTNWVIGDNQVAVEIDYVATLTQDLPNGLKKGTTLNLKGVSIYEFESGKIKRLVDFS